MAEQHTTLTDAMAKLNLDYLSLQQEMEAVKREKAILYVAPTLNRTL